MANQQRLADNLNRYDAHRQGVPRRGNALLQGIAVCGRCDRRMGLHYSRPHGNYPSMFVAQTSINMADHVARRFAPWVLMSQSKDYCSKR